MEIKTRRDAARTAEGPPDPPPEKNRYLRRKAVQKVRRTPWARRVLLRGLKVAIGAAALAAMAGCVVAAAYFFLASMRFDTGTVTFVGCRRSSPVQLEAIVRREFPSGTLRIDLHAVCDRLEREAWIRQAD